MKPAQKLKGARLEAGQTQGKRRRVFAGAPGGKQGCGEKPPGVFTVCFGYGVSCGLGVSVLAFWMGGRTDAMGYSLVVFLCRSPVEHAGAVLFIGCGRAWDGCKRTMLFFLER